MYDAKYVTSNCFDIDEVLTREKFMYESSHECADGMQAIFSAIKDSMRGIVTSLVFIVAAIISLGIINANNDASPGANIAMFLIIFLWLLPSIAVIIVTIVKSLSPMHYVVTDKGIYKYSKNRKEANKISYDCVKSLKLEIKGNSAFSDNCEIKISHEVPDSSCITDRRYTGRNIIVTRVKSGPNIKEIYNYIDMARMGRGAYAGAYNSANNYNANPYGNSTTNTYSNPPANNYGVTPNNNYNGTASGNPYSAPKDEMEGLDLKNLRK